MSEAVVWVLVNSLMVFGIYTASLAVEAIAIVLAVTRRSAFVRAYVGGVLVFVALFNLAPTIAIWVLVTRPFG